ncbi:MAG: leucine-rich repeat protein [Blautia sp.]|nr:leucine-rich repeat protein [Blautia sp.]
MVDSNTVLNGKSTTYKNIFLYQSMSGDAAVGLATFSAEGTSFTTKKGDVFYVTNTTASINLKGNTFQNSSDGILLRAEAGPWGNSGSNGGKVTLTATSQDLEGNIVVDSVSSLDMTLGSGSSYTGAINTGGKGGLVSVTLKDGATWSLTGNSTISSFTGSEDSIQKNGYTLTITGEEATGDSSQEGTTPGGNEGNTPPAMPGGNAPSGEGGQIPTPPAMPEGNAPSGENGQMPTPPAMPTTTPTPTPEGTESQSAQTLKVGTKLQDKYGNLYQVSKAGTTGKNGAVTFLSPSDKSVETVTIPASVKISGVTYKVTAIAANAFSGCNALQSVTIGKNVQIIGKKAFASCQTLNSLVIKSAKLTAAKIQKGAFSGTGEGITVTVPKAKLKLYKKILKAKGISKNAKWKTA